MEKKKTVEQTVIECDGCQYIMGRAPAPILVTVPLHDNAEPLVFHFHTLHNRHDCFRYWAHNPRVMIRSLKERGLGDEDVEAFMELMLYRESKFGPGIDRPETKPEPASRYT